MKNEQLTLIDPILYTEFGKSISGTLSFSQLQRFSDLAKFDDKDIDYLLSFIYDEEQRCCIEGKAKVVVKLECNKCLNLFSYEIDTSFRLYPIKECDINKLSKQLDVVMMENGLISVVKVIEDELLLSLPEVPKHAANDPNCGSLAITWASEDLVQQQENPFVILKDLKATNSKK